MTGAPAGNGGLAAGLRHAVSAALWLATFKLLADHGWRLIPLSLAGKLSMQAYLTLVMLVTTAVGLGASWLLLRDPPAELGLRRPRPGALAWTALLALPAYVAASYLAIYVALPTLLEELTRSGRQVVQQQTGEFGRTLVQAPLPTLLLWAVVVTPVAEELLFRGAWWSLFARAGRALARRDAAPSSEALPSGVLEPSLVLKVAASARRWFAEGGLATLASALVFAAMHAGMPGGLGIVRVVAAFGLGLATGVARHATGGLAAPILLHVLYNFVSLGTTRRWWVSETFPMKLGVPTLATAAAGGSLLLAVALWLVLRRRSAR
ncbi:MAG: CPBP family intramembrane metalloprotease [Polyangiaceae bacterium]|nr:CPBP family intramembrane metalloprotease [Polyangiaceae bacterium]